MTKFVEHYEKREYVYPLSRKTIYFKLKTNIEDIKKIEFIYYEKIRKIDEKSVTMKNFSIQGNSQLYYGILEYDETIKYVDYYFLITCDNCQLYYSPEGLREIKPQRTFRYSDTNYYDVFKTPKWAKGLIGYQIFPDRFNIGEEVLIQKHSDWYDIPTTGNFYGGNIAGIIDKIDYLKELNVGLVYLTPIFKSHSNHKYDTLDYFEIDPGFGSKTEFKNLVEKLHEAGIKIILDGVFNHIGYYSNQFQDVIKKGKVSKYYNWFYVNGNEIDVDEVNYECVGYFKWMPKLRYQCLELREFVKSIGEYWLKDFDIDGYRLDVSDEVDITFWQEFRRHIKSLDSEAILIGETWKNGSDLLRGDTMDSVMNYRLRDALLDLLVNNRQNIDEFIDQVDAIYFDYPKQCHDILYNTLGSHDTDRILTLCDKNEQKLYLMASIVFALPGIPFIYYGDELGMTGSNDPLSRKAMRWNNLENDVHRKFKQLTALRESSDVLKYGDYSQFKISESVYGILRNFQGSEMILIANVTDKSKSIVFKYKNYEQEITLLPYESEFIKIQ